MMTYFEFSKEIHHRYFVEGFGILENWKVYKIEQGEKHIGQFYYHRQICFFEYEDKEMDIRPKRRFLRSTLASIFDRRMNVEVGTMEVPGWHPRTNPIGFIQLGGEYYTGLKLRPEVDRSFFKPRTWGHRKYSVSNTHEDVVYAFRPTASSTSAFMGGKISVAGNNLLLLFAGLFLLEEQLDKEEDRS
jgi:hypothetical protein